MFIVCPIGRRVEQSDFLHQPRLRIRHALVFETFIQCRRASLHVLGFRVLEHTLEESDTPDVIARCLGDAISSSAIVAIPTNKIDEPAATRGVGRNTLGK